MAREGGDMIERAQPRVTVVVPTRDRAGLLNVCLASVLAQDIDDMRVDVHDNASTDDTPAVVASFADERLRYHRRTSNVGLFRNWQLALEQVTTPSVTLLQDDDLWRPGFLAKTLDLLDGDEEVTFAFSDVELIDLAGGLIGRRATTLPAGCFAGAEYLHRVVDGENLVIDMSATVLRTSALRRAGGLDLPHQIHDIVFNLQFRLAGAGRLARVPEPLCQVRHHAGQSHRGDLGNGAAIGMAADRMEAATRLLGSPRAEDPAYRSWLAERLLMLGRLRSQYTADALPSQLGPGPARLDLAVDDLVAAVPAGAGLLLIDGAQLVDERLGRFRLWPFTEIDGQYGGPPADGAAAVRELDRLLDVGARYVAVVWPALWWLDHYTALRERLAQGTVLVDNSRVVVFDLDPRR